MDVKEWIPCFERGGIGVEGREGGVVYLFAGYLGGGVSYEMIKRRWNE